MRAPAIPLDMLVLASTSQYRRELLGRLRLEFITFAPRLNEAPLAGESATATASRLALAKARAAVDTYPDALIIGSDQVAELDGDAIGKPGDHERATAQLRRMSGRTVVFHTAVSVLHLTAGYHGDFVVPVRVRFRRLDAEEIERYLRAEQPYDCAGSAKCETLGIALLEAIESDDPTALVGLPLIRTSELLRQAGIDPLRAATASSGTARAGLS